jgi:hypothetical protein
MKTLQKAILTGIVTALCATPVLAQGQGKGQGHGNAAHGQRMGSESSDRGPQGNGPGRYDHDDGGARSGLSVSLRFSTDQRSAIHDYYSDLMRGGNCPPGLAKKHNGCQPPGQARKWRVGYPLDSDIRFYRLDAGLAERLGPAPRGYRYVRVASDILMLAVGTNLVVDAIEDLSR